MLKRSVLRAQIPPSEVPFGTFLTDSTADTFHINTPINLI